MSLHDELHDIAEAAPLARPDAAAAWRDGQTLRRGRRRRTTGAVLAAAATVAILAGLVTWLPRGDDPAPASGTAALGVPDHVYAVPERFGGRSADGEWASSQISDDLAVGRGAVAFTTRDNIPVVIDAATGGYHLLDLPDTLGNTRTTMGKDPQVALSPDGRSLAYGWAQVGPDAATAPVPSGVRVVDLEDGSIRTIVVAGLQGTQALRFAWSPDSRWLAWGGDQMTSWSAASMSGRVAAAGLVAPGATTSAPVSGEVGRQDLAVDDSGAVTVAELGYQVAFSSEGTLAASTPRRVDIEFVDGTNGEATRVTSVPRDSRDPQGGFAFDPIGWVGTEAALTIGVPGYPESPDDPVLLVVGPTIPAMQVAELDAALTDADLSVATDLMTLDRPTVERPEPDWPWSTARRVWTLGGGAGVLVLLALVVASSRKRRFGGGDKHLHDRPAHGEAWSIHGGGGGMPGGGF